MAEGGDQGSSRGQEGTQPDKLSHLSIPQFSLSLVCMQVWTSGLSWHRQQLSLQLCHPWFLPDTHKISYMHNLSPLHSSDFNFKLGYQGGRSTPAPPVVTPSKLTPHCWILRQLLSIDWSCHPHRHPWPPSATRDPWWGERFKWFFSNSRQPVFPVRWLLMATIEKGIMEIPKTICPFDLQTLMSPEVVREQRMNDLEACCNTIKHCFCLSFQRSQKLQCVSLDTLATWSSFFASLSFP